MYTDSDVPEARGRCLQSVAGKYQQERCRGRADNTNLQCRQLSACMVLAIGVCGGCHVETPCDHRVDKNDKILTLCIACFVIWSHVSLEGVSVVCNLEADVPFQMTHGHAMHSNTRSQPFL